MPGGFALLILKEILSSPSSHLPGRLRKFLLLLPSPLQQILLTKILSNNRAVAKKKTNSWNADAGEAKTNLRDLFAGLQTPGSSIQSSLERARQGENLGYGASGSGDSLHRFDKRQPNFSVDEPTILSDTRGVDFGPWLRLIYFRVRDNWYSVIPELIRSGTKAKVIVIFDILNNGRIENLQIVRSSGLSPYDRAAVSSLKLSEPFPSFPASFSGERITLQFSYFYNIRL
ncbi:MAG: hypothetical protein DMG05_01695 [Acidobacteria bacterium]|nr:MAG: hypothetical protein DMG05_01695 [Acidobacteriota bacterium]